MVKERVRALRDAIENQFPTNPIYLQVYDKAIEQDPEAEGFWETWEDLMTNYFGAQAGDYIVASEAYGKQVADLVGMKFFPFDLNRNLNEAKATKIRDNPEAYFKYILPEFRKYLQVRITLFGAESTGKTTLAHLISSFFTAPALWEFARPYLEINGSEITVEAMKDIWRGQLALQTQAETLVRPVVVQDTDLFSTVGYWALPHWQDKLGHPPIQLAADASAYKSDLYIVCPSNIPFEEDPLRYGGNIRESDDQYWIDLLEEFGLPYVVLKESDHYGRYMEAHDHIRETLDKKMGQIKYDRKGL